MTDLVLFAAFYDHTVVNKKVAASKKVACEF